MLEVRKVQIFDKDKDKSWYHLMPTAVSLKLPKIFASNVAVSIPEITGYEFQRAGLYT